MIEPKIEIFPDVGWSNPASKLINVDLPAPDVPIMATDSPALMLKEIPFRIDSSLALLMTDLVIFSTLIMDWLMIKLVSLLCTLLFSSIVNSNTLLIVGDSLSAGYKMPVENSWPVLLPEKLKQQNQQIKIINASISGDTSGNGLARLPALLAKHQPDYVLLELGANDGLRGFSPDIVSNNLSAMIDQVKTKKAQPILMQLRVPTNYGKRYGDAFSNIYPSLSEEKSVPLMPFFLEYVITKPEWMMSDGLHPKEIAQPWIAEFIATELGKIIK